MNRETSATSVKAALCIVVAGLVLLAWQRRISRPEAGPQHQP